MLVVFFVFLFAIRTFERNIDWTNEETLYRYTNNYYELNCYSYVSTGCVCRISCLLG